MRVGVGTMRRTRLSRRQDLDPLNNTITSLSACPEHRRVPGQHCWTSQPLTSLETGTHLVVAGFWYTEHSQVFCVLI